MVKIEIFQQFQQISARSTTKKSGIVEKVMIKFGLTILTTEVLEFWEWQWSNLV
jgi:hypothetical protein